MIHTSDLHFYALVMWGAIGIYFFYGVIKYRKQFLNFSKQTLEDNQELQHIEI